MLNELIKYLEKPELGYPSKENFWDDKYISQHLLNNHLNPTFEGASRKFAFIDASVKWLKQIIPSKRYPSLLDVGCGPGLYAERFVKSGYNVTAIDFSKRSIAYAKASAFEQELNIDYRYENYLQLNEKNKYNVATLIYCDYCALSTKSRKLLMENIYNSLVIGGRFILDVFSDINYANFEEKQTWEIYSQGGFWREEPYFLFSDNRKYENNVTLEKSVVITEKKIESYYIWNYCFSKEDLLREAEAVGFNIIEFFADVAGNPYSSENTTIAVVLEK